MLPPLPRSIPNIDNTAVEMCSSSFRPCNSKASLRDYFVIKNGFILFL